MIEGMEKLDGGFGHRIASVYEYFSRALAA